MACKRTPGFLVADQKWTKLGILFFLPICFKLTSANPLIYNAPKPIIPVYQDGNEIEEFPVGYNQLESQSSELDLPADLKLTQENDISSQGEPTFLPLSMPIGQASGIAISPNNTLVLFHRSGRVWDENSFDERNRFNPKLGPINNSTIALIDSETGRLISEHGKDMFYLPHGLTIDSAGNYWLTDVGTHQIYKLDQKFKPLLTIGEKMIPGNSNYQFCKPTDIAVASTGEFFVADGYCNSRIMKFSKEGKFISKFGGHNTANPPRPGEFFVPHSLALIEDMNLLCIADRENERIQCFSAGLDGSINQKLHRRAYIPMGKFFTKAEGIGRVFAIREKQHYLIGVTDRGKSQLRPQMFFIDLNTGRANTFDEGIENAHSVAINENGDLFVSQLEPSQIIKFNFPVEALKNE